MYIPITDTHSFGRQIRLARKAQGLTQADLALSAGTGERFISELERGKPTAHLGKALHVAHLVGLALYTQNGAD